MITRDQLRVRWTRAITPRLSLLAGLRGTYDEDVDPSGDVCSHARYATGDVGLQWLWQEEFSLRAAYDYTLAGIPRQWRTTPRRAAPCITVLYQPQQRRRARND